MLDHLEEQDFCTFSGQVIASVKIYDEFKLKGAYLDLDGHYGNSIEDSRNFVKTKDGLTLDDILPRDCNINPSGHDKNYMYSLGNHLENLVEKIMSGKVHYVVACSGADSLIDDDLGGQLKYSDWIMAKHIIYDTIKECSLRLGKPVPLTISLFGGYRRDHYESVLDAHTRDLLECMRVLQDKTEPLKNYKKVYRVKK
jgi:acetoin utilization deacetylase AcuC-like enzyme